MSGERSRSGCASPAWARSGPWRCPRRARTTSSSARVRSGVSRGTETLVFRGGVPASQYAAMRAPFQEGDFPGPVKYGYLNVGVVEQGPAAAAGSHRLLPLPAPDRLRRPGRGRASSVPDGVPPRAPCWPARSRPPSTRCGTPRRCVGDRVTVVGAGMVGCCVARLLARIPGVRVTLVDVDAGRGPRCRSARRRLRRCPDGRRPSGPSTSSCTPARPRPGCSCRWTCSAPEGDGDRAQLVRRPRGAAVASAGRSTPRRLGIRASQVGAVAPARRGRRTTPTGWPSPWTCCSDPAFDALITGSRRSTNCPTSWPGWRTGPAGALPHHHLRRGVRPCSA